VARALPSGPAWGDAWSGRQDTGRWSRLASSVVRGGDHLRPERRAAGGARLGLCRRHGVPALTAALQSRVREDGERESRDRPVVRVLRDRPGPYVAVLAVVRADARPQDERAAGLACGLQRVEDAWSIVGVERAKPVGIGARGRRILISEVRKKRTLRRRPYADSFFSRDPRASLTTDGSPLT
jgi:hypothetical protein